MASWEEVLKNREQYPDTMEIPNLGVSVGDLRNGFVPKADLTKATQEQAERFKKEQQQLANAMQQREQMLQGQLAQAMQAQGVNARHAQDDDLTAYRNDPAFGPLVKHLDAVRQQNEQLQQRIQNDEISFRTVRYNDDLAKLREQDKELDQNRLVSYASELWRGGPDLHAAHRLLNYDKDMARIRKEAEESGYKRAKEEPPAPPMPRASRGQGTTTQAPKFKNMNEAAQAAVQDPDFQALANSVLSV